MVEPLGDAVDHRGLQRVVVQDRRIDEGRELGLAPHDLLGLAADARPDRVDLVERVGGSRLLLGHDRLPRIRSRVSSSTIAPSDHIWRQGQASSGLPARSRPLGKKVQHGLLEHLVADRQHVVAVRECRAPRAWAAAPPAPAREPAIVVLAADRDQHRHADRRRPPRASAPGASRGCRRRAPCGRTWSARRRRGTCGPADRSRRRATAPPAPRRCSPAGPTPSTRWMPSPPSTARAHALRMRERQERGDARAHRIAHHVGARDVEMIEQRAHVLRHAARCDRRPDRRAWSMRRGRDCRARSRAGRRASASRPSRDAPSSPPWSRRSRGPARSARPRLRRGKRNLDGAVGENAACGETYRRPVARTLASRHRSGVRPAAASSRSSRSRALRAVDGALGQSRSTPLLSDDTKPNSVRIAPRTSTRPD